MNLLQHHPLRAPRHHGALLIEPPWDMAGELLKRNQSLSDGHAFCIGDVPFAELARQARAQLLQAALAYTAQYRDVDLQGADPARLILAGHQPQLFHAGVWFKNFALAELARQQRAVGINLVVDSDTLKQAAIRVPGGSPAAPTASMIALDAPSSEIPYEDRAVVDPALFDSFGQRAASELRGLVPDTMVAEFWSRVVQRRQQTSLLGECLSQARHQLEGAWGSSTLEVPQSQVCQLPAFDQFAAYLLSELPRLRAVYNQAAEEYRQVNRIRNANHPVPNLAESDGWLEAPFWIWQQSAPRRRHVFVKHAADHWLVSDRHGIEIQLPLAVDRAAEVLAGLPARGIRFRTRALMTTLFARLFLSDLFLHGIGGGKYDQLTDLIVSRFFGVQPPAFMILSATLQLPVARPGVSADDLRRVDEKLRNLRFRPETFLNLKELSVEGRRTAEAAQAAKRQWISTERTASNGRVRHLEIQQANAILTSLLTEQRAALLEQRAALTAALPREALLASREHAFCLFPEAFLRNFFLEFASAKP